MTDSTEPSQPTQAEVAAAIEWFAARHPVHAALEEAQARFAAAQKDVHRLSAERNKMIGSLAEAVRRAGFPWGDGEPRDGIRWGSRMPEERPAVKFRVGGVWFRRHDG